MHGALMQLLSGSLYSALVAAAAELQIAEGLSEPRTTAELAARSGAHEDGLARLLRALAVLGLVELLPDGRWRGSEALAFLREDADGGLRALALLQAEPAIGGAWQRCAQAVRTGATGFELANGKKMFDFLDGDERLRRLFQRSLRGSAGWNEAIVQALDLDGCGVLVDVGAGDGELVAALARRWPGLRGIAFERATVATVATAQAGVEWVGGDFFAGVPEADAYLLRWVLHDWPDAEATRILERCRASLRPGGAVYIVENLLGDPTTALLDMSMLILTGGRERSLEEYAVLLHAAGLRLEKATATRAGVKILEAR